MNAKKLSVVYIAQNAEKYLQRSIDSISAIADEILLVDSGSTDETLNIAAKNHVSVISRSWLGFSAQRQFAVDAASNNWILMLDADEILTSSAAKIVADIMSDDCSSSAYYLSRRSFFHGKKICHGDWRRDRVIRLFNRHNGHYGNHLVHESWQTNDVITSVRGVSILHYSYENYGELIDKMRRYAILNAQQLHQQGKRLRSYMPLTHALAAFVRGYVWRLGFLDGVEGAAIACSAAMGAFMKYAIALELRDQKRQ